MRSDYMELTIRPTHETRVEISLGARANGEVYIMGRLLGEGQEYNSTFYLARLTNAGELQLINSIPRKLGFNLDSAGRLIVRKGGDDS